MPPSKDAPWIFRTYSGHSSAKKSNELYKMNLSKGQTGLSVAFDLPTQTGYDSDHVLARGEVGKVGVPICSIQDMEDLFKGLPLEKMNTSMTINATAVWLMALYVVCGERQGGNPKNLTGTTQNDILKEYLSRGTYIFPPGPSLKLTTDLITYTSQNIPAWNPVNVCAYHLQEAGATPAQELAYTFANALAILDAVKNREEISEKDFAQIVGRISFFLDSGLRFIEEMCKTRAFTQMWRDLCAERYGITDEKLTRFRYGVQVNSLNLTEAQPENNIIRIIYEILGVTLARDSRARAVQLPAWNEALGLPKPWDQQWSLRVQQILALETDLLEYADIFSGSKVIEEKVKSLVQDAKKELNKILEMGGAVPAIESGYIKSQLVHSHGQRLKEIAEGKRKIVGVNCFQDSEPSPFTLEECFVKCDETSEQAQIEKLQAFRRGRNQKDVMAALKNLNEVLKNGGNVMEPSLLCAKAGVTTGEWSQNLREIFGEYRAPTGVSNVVILTDSDGTKKIRDDVKKVEKKLGHKIRILVGKPGLDGHSSGAEQIALKARDIGMEVIYQGIRLTPEEICATAIQEDVDVIGLSILSGSHLFLISEILKLLKKNGADIPVVLGGIIPQQDHEKLLRLGVKKIFTPKDFELDAIMCEIVKILGVP